MEERGKYLQVISLGVVIVNLLIDFLGTNTGGDKSIQNVQIGYSTAQLSKVFDSVHGGGEAVVDPGDELGFGRVLFGGRKRASRG